MFCSEGERINKQIKYKLYQVISVLCAAAGLRSQSSWGSQAAGCPMPHPRTDFATYPGPLLHGDLTKTCSPSSIAPWWPMAGTCQWSRSLGAFCPHIFRFIVSLTYLPPACLCLVPRFPLCLKSWLRVTLTLLRVTGPLLVGGEGDAVFSMR